ncbi:hypothetical protein HYY75_13040, partial [bacterium]|nr:hypothetical protein [bacterium]
MKKQFSVLLFLFFPAFVVFPQIEVPVEYNLGVGSGTLISGFIIGGSFCELEGLSVNLNPATTPTVLHYETLDCVSNISLREEKLLSMEILVRGGRKYEACARISEVEPMIILRDEVPNGLASQSGKVRIFKKDGFRGIPLIRFEAEIPSDIDFDLIKTLNSKFLEAIESRDVEKAIE